MKITFTNMWKDVDLSLPVPSDKVIPEWYKNTQSYFTGKKSTDGNHGTAATIKRCMPVFDALTAGYIITTPADVYVSKVDGRTHYEWAALNLIGQHSKVQAPLYPAVKEDTIPKWHNPWSIKTPKGYSCLFVQPFHRESVFSVMPAVVDTDTYIYPVTLPFLLKEGFEGLIPAGTPMVQVIPFKRDTWEMEEGKEKEFEEAIKVNSKASLYFFDKYKNMFRTKKEYK